MIEVYSSVVNGCLLKIVFEIIDKVIGVGVESYELIVNVESTKNVSDSLVRSF